MRIFGALIPKMGGGVKSSSDEKENFRRNEGKT
jgi:hypothetical protein